MVCPAAAQRMSCPFRRCAECVYEAMAHLAKWFCMALRMHALLSAALVSRGSGRGGADPTTARCARSNNTLTGSLPPEWQQLTQLQELSAVRAAGHSASCCWRSRFCSVPA